MNTETGANSITGVLDYKYAEIVEDPFRRVQNKEAHMMELIKKSDVCYWCHSKYNEKSNEEIVKQFNRLPAKVENTKQTPISYLIFIIQR